MDLANQAKSNGNAAALVWFAWVAMVGAAFFFLFSYGQPVPYLDDWEIVETFTGNRPVDVAWLWAPHNEHRIPLARLALLSLLHSSHGDFRAGMVASACLLSALSAAMILAARFIRGRTALSDIIFPLLLLNWGHCEALLWCWQLGFVLATFLAGICLLAIATYQGQWTWSRIVVLGVGLLLLPLCGANGLALLPALAVWTCATGIWAMRSERRIPGLAILAIGALALGLIVAYVKDLSPMRGGQQIRIRDVLWTAWQFLSVGFGLIPQKYWPLPGVVVLASLGLAVVLLGRSWFCDPGHRPRTLGLLCFLAAIISVALAVGLGRGGIPNLGLARRYVTLSAVGVCALYFVAVTLEPTRVSRAWQWALAGIALLTAVSSAQQGLAYGREMSANLASFTADIRHGLPPLALVEPYSRYPHVIYPHRQPFAKYLRMLKEKRIGPFASMKDDPSLRALDLAEAGATHVEDNTFAFAKPIYIAAVRLTYQYKPTAPLAIMRLFWTSAKAAPSPRQHTIQQYLLQEERPETVLFWVDDVVSRIGIAPDDKPTSCELTKIQLLVPP
jgi:hypothetical protein